jgi:hypothetical protein
MDVEETLDVWKPKKKRITSKAAKLRVKAHAKATGTETLEFDVSRKALRRQTSSPARTYREIAFGVTATSRDYGSGDFASADGELPYQPEPEPEVATMPFPPRKGSLPDDAVDDPGHTQPAATKKITIAKGAAGFGFSVNDICVVTRVAGASMEAGVPENSRIIAVAGNAVTSKPDILVQLRALGSNVPSIEFTFQLPDVDEQGSTAPPRVRPPERPRMTSVSLRPAKVGPQMMLRLVRVAVADPKIYTSAFQQKRLRVALKVDESHNRTYEKKERKYDKQVVLAAWHAYATLRYNALTCKTRDDMLQKASQVLHVLVALMACITVSLEIDLEGLGVTPFAEIEAGNVPIWSPKNSLSGDMDDNWVTWVTHGFNFVGPCVLIAVLGLQADWSDDVRWGGHLLRAERLRSAIFSYRGRVGEWSLPAIPRGGWWHEQMASTSSSTDDPSLARGGSVSLSEADHETADDLNGIGAKTRERNREKLNQLQEETLAAAMTRASNTAAQATIPAVIKVGVALSLFGLLLVITGIYAELQYDDRPLALLLFLCGITGIGIGIVVIKPLANQAHEGRSRDMKPLKEPTAAFMQACAPPFELKLPWHKDVGISMGSAGSAPAAAGASGAGAGAAGAGGTAAVGSAVGGEDQVAAVQATMVDAIDHGFAPINAEEYLTFRAYPLRAELGQLGPQLSARLRQIQRLLFLSSFASALCAIAAPVFQRHLAVWVCLFNTIGCSVLVYSHRTSARELACAANTTCVTLDACLDWWLTLPVERRHQSESFERLVSDIERAVEVLCVVWTTSELELPNQREREEHARLGGTMQRVQMHVRDRDAMLRKMIQPRGGKFLL